jgi:CRISPR-associated protein Cas2
MKVILVYDIALQDTKDQNRLNKVRKIVKKYLHHIQKSVFEGELSEAKLEKLKIEIKRIIDKNRDMVLIYIFESKTNYKREFLTHIKPDDNNII